jgi:hypothetical protein
MRLFPSGKLLLSTHRLIEFEVVNLRRSMESSFQASANAAQRSHGAMNPARTKTESAIA